MQALSSCERSIYVDGVGWLDQYGSYADNLWESCVIYFVRDSTHQSLMYHYARGEPYAHLEEQLHRLNSDISAWEHGAATRTPECVGRRHVDSDSSGLADPHPASVGARLGDAAHGPAAAEPVADTQALRQDLDRPAA